MKKALLTKFSAIVLIILVVLSMTACKPEEIDYLIMKTAIGNSAYYPNIGLVVDINPIDIDYDDFVIQWKVSSGKIYSFDADMNPVEIDLSIEGCPITYLSDDNFGSILWVPEVTADPEDTTIEIFLYKNYDSSSPFAHDTAVIKSINGTYGVQ